MRSEQDKVFRFSPRGPSPLLLLLALFFGATPVSAITDEVVARVGEREILESAVQAGVTSRINSGYFHRNVSDEQVMALRNEELDGLIRRELKAYAGLDAELSLPLDRAREAAGQIEESLGTENYEASIGSLGWDRQRHVHEIARTFLAEEAWKRLVEDVVRVSDDAVKAIWSEDPTRWAVPEQIHVRHILIRTSPSASAEGVAERRKFAEQIVSRIAQGEDFADLASEVSDDNYRIRGGDLGWIHRGRLLPELDAVAWEAELDEVYGPIRSLEGFHVLQVLGRREGQAMTFGEARPMVRDMMEKKLLDEAARVLYERALESHPVEVLDDSLSWVP